MFMRVSAKCTHVYLYTCVQNHSLLSRQKCVLVYMCTFARKAKCVLVYMYTFCWSFPLLFTLSLRFSRVCACSCVRGVCAYTRGRTLACTRACACVIAAALSEVPRWRLAAVHAAKRKQGESMRKGRGYRRRKTGRQCHTHALASRQNPKGRRGRKSEMAPFNPGVGSKSIYLLKFLD